MRNTYHSQFTLATAELFIVARTWVVSYTCVFVAEPTLSVHEVFDVKFYFVMYWEYTNLLIDWMSRINGKLIFLLLLTKIWGPTSRLPRSSSMNLLIALSWVFLASTLLHSCWTMKKWKNHNMIMKYLKMNIMNVNHFLLHGSLTHKVWWNDLLSQTDHKWGASNVSQ